MKIVLSPSGALRTELFRTSNEILFEPHKISLKKNPENYSATAFFIVDLCDVKPFLQPCKYYIHLRVRSRFVD